MSRRSQQRRTARRARERKRQKAKAARRLGRQVVEQHVLLISTFADAAEMNVAGGPLAADDHPECGRYGLRTRVILGDGLLMQTDGIHPGCMPIWEAEENALRALHDDAAARGDVPDRVTYQCARPFRQITERGQRLLLSAQDDSPLIERELELAKRELVQVESKRPGPLGAWRRWRRPQRRAA